MPTAHELIVTGYEGTYIVRVEPKGEGSQKELQFITDKLHSFLKGFHATREEVLA